MTAAFVPVFYPEPPPEVLDLALLSPRVRCMILLLLAHAAVIAQYDIMSVELHCHRDRDGARDSVKPKLHLCP